jgi:mRNA-degrading endonuclease RelE of RelBE toxin-antitoxin system
MLTPEQIQKDVQELPKEAQALLADFIEILKKRYPKPPQQEAQSEQSPYRKFKESGFIGCVSIEENLSATYKQVLSEQLSTKSRSLC